MKTTKIQWCDSTINGSSGCDGCELWKPGTHTCYAGTLHETRLAKSLPALYAADFSEVRMIPGRFSQAANWKDLTGTARPDKPWLDGRPRHIFVGDMGDFLSKSVTDEFLKRELIGAIASKNGSRHTWMLLTKRPDRLAFFAASLGGLPDNVIAMTTVTNQRTADVRIPALLRVNAKRHMISCEPLLGPLDLTRFFLKSADGSYPFSGIAKEHRTTWLHLLDGIICGGESGNDARAMHPDWARALRDQAIEYRVPFFFKQWGEWGGSCEHGSHDPGVPGKPEIVMPPYVMYRMGKALTGRQLDGREWNEMPRLPSDLSKS